MTSTWYSAPPRLRSRPKQLAVWLWVTPLSAAVGYGSYSAGYAFMGLVFGGA